MEVRCPNGLIIMAVLICEFSCFNVISILSYKEFDTVTAAVVATYGPAFAPVSLHLCTAAPSHITVFDPTKAIVGCPQEDTPTSPTLTICFASANTVFAPDPNTVM